MRTFYLYDVNELCYDLYEEYPYQLYSLLKDIYYTSKYDLVSARIHYEQVTTFFHKAFLNNYLHQKFCLNHYYHENGNIHTVSSYHEYSKVMVSNYSIKLKSNLNNPSFFNHLLDYSDFLFVCDFENGDFFWLSKVLKREKILVNS